MAPSRGPASLPRTLHTTLSNHKGAVHVVRYAKGSAKYVLSGGQDRTVRLWNPELGTEIKKYAAHGYEVLSVSVYDAYLCVLCCNCANTTPALMIMQNLRPLGATARCFCGTSWRVRRYGGLLGTWGKSSWLTSTQTRVWLPVVRTFFRSTNAQPRRTR